MSVNSIESFPADVETNIFLNLICLTKSALLKSSDPTFALGPTPVVSLRLIVPGITVGGVGVDDDEDVEDEDGASQITSL